MSIRTNPKFFTYPSFVNQSDLYKIISLSRTIKTPAYVIDEKLLEDNLKTLKKVKDATNCKILFAIKAYALYATFPLIAKYLDGICATGVNESRLGYEYFKKEVQTYNAAFKNNDIAELIKYSDTVIFNSFHQLKKYSAQLKKAEKQIGVRVNPGLSASPSALYSPSAPYSRLGIIRQHFVGQDLTGVDGLHWHTLCQQDATTLKPILEKFEKDFKPYIKQMKWVNFGGGHHITRRGYNLRLLCKLINNFKKKYGVQVYLEPGEAVVLNAGYLVSTILDIIDNKMKLVILDTSAEAHMPDVLGMPYRPEIINAGKKGQKKYTYRLGGQTCLTGDVIGDYSFDHPLRIGDKLIFTDMALYSFVKNNTFNGINPPDLGLLTKAGNYKVIKRFNYKDFKNRLGN